MYRDKVVLRVASVSVQPPCVWLGARGIAHQELTRLHLYALVPPDAGVYGAGARCECGRL